MNLEDFPKDLPRTSLENEKLTALPIHEFAQITPIFGAQIRIFNYGEETFQTFSGQHSYNADEPGPRLVYVLGVVEEHRTFHYVGPLKEDKRVQEVIKKLNGATYSLAYLERNARPTVHLIGIESIVSYETLKKGI